MNHANHLEAYPNSNSNSEALRQRGHAQNLTTPASTSLPGFTSARRRFPEETLGYEAAATIAGDPDKLSLTGMLIARATQGSDARFEKVAALRQAIAAGTYRVPSQDVAAKLIDDMKI